MNDIIIYKETNKVIVITSNLNRTFVFRSMDKNNNHLVPTYVLHVNDADMKNIKITLPQVNTNVTIIP